MLKTHLHRSMKMFNLVQSRKSCLQQSDNICQFSALFSYLCGLRIARHVTEQLLWREKLHTPVPVRELHS